MWIQVLQLNSNFEQFESNKGVLLSVLLVSSTDGAELSLAVAAYDEVHGRTEKLGRRSVTCGAGLSAPDESSCHRVEANDGSNTGNGKFAHLAASSRT